MGCSFVFTLQTLCLLTPSTDLPLQPLLSATLTGRFCSCTYAVPIIKCCHSVTTVHLINPFALLNVEVKTVFLVASNCSVSNSLGDAGIPLTSGFLSTLAQGKPEDHYLKSE